MKLAAMLRIVPAVQLAFAKFVALLRSKESVEPLASEFLSEASDVPRSTVDQPTAISVPETIGWSEREQLILRRWSETGIKLWNPDFHGAGRAALNIQGQSKLLPPKPGRNIARI